VVPLGTLLNYKPRTFLAFLSPIIRELEGIVEGSGKQVLLRLPLLQRLLSDFCFLFFPTPPPSFFCEPKGRPVLSRHWLSARFLPKRLLALIVSGGFFLPYRLPPSFRVPRNTRRYLALSIFFAGSSFLSCPRLSILLSVLALAGFFSIRHVFLLHHRHSLPFFWRSRIPSP